jgi:hypothetical protein
MGVSKHSSCRFDPRCAIIGGGAIGDKKERPLNAVFFVLAVFLGIWAAIRYHIVYCKIRDTFPPQFQDDLPSRYAFPVYALSHSTPLPLQAEYMKSLGCACACFFCVSLAFFASGNIPFGILCLLASFAITFSTMKSWKTYKENSRRAEAQQTKDWL